MAEADPGRGGASPTFARWTHADCRKVHEANLQILERTGVRLLDAEALAMLRHAGARVDGDRGGGSLGKRASRQVSEILASHEPEPLAPAIIDRLRTIRARANDSPGLVDQSTAGRGVRT